MFHPVGSQPPSVYWRRRLLLLGSLAVLIVLLALTVRTVTSHDGKPAGAAGTHSSSPLDTTPVASTSHPHTSSSPPPTSPATSPSGSGSNSSSSAAPLPCDWHKLTVSAVSAKSSWHVGDEPVLELQVTNVGTQACVQDLADSQVVLNVYNGESRVWGSHDCQVQPGTDDRTLAVNMPVNVAIMWSGLSSQPNCAGTRQRVGAGTYTLYAALSGHTGKATQFTIS